jgi:hypothetical protein
MKRKVRSVWLRAYRPGETSSLEGPPIRPPPPQRRRPGQGLNPASRRHLPACPCHTAATVRPPTERAEENAIRARTRLIAADGSLTVTSRGAQIRSLCAPTSTGSADVRACSGTAEAPLRAVTLGGSGAWSAHPASDARSHPAAVPTSAAGRPTIVMEFGKLPPILMHGSMLPVVRARWLIVMNGGDSRRMQP